MLLHFTEKEGGVRKLCVIAANLVLVNSAFAVVSISNWGYDGTQGPSHWGDIPAYSLCGTGKAQSPINISRASAAIMPLQFHYTSNSVQEENQGNYGKHSLLVMYPDKKQNYIEFNQDRYALVQFHFHTPSEHRIDGKSFPMEMHLVHQDAIGRMLVVAVMINVSAKGNVALSKVLHDIPKFGNDDTLNFNVTDLLPVSQSYYTYSGSLTTPPCTEAVSWIVMMQPINIDAADLAAYQKQVIPVNARPVQPLNGRIVKVSP